MYEVNSQTITENQKAETVPAKEWKFQITNGNTGEKTIVDPLIETEVIANERAKSEFLKNSYKLNEISFSTYRTDLAKNMEISVYGMTYLVKSISATTNAVSIKTRIRAVRYD